MKFIFLGLILGVLCGCKTNPTSTAAGSPIPSQSPILNFHLVEDGIYRGARPELAGLQWLASQGIKTVINLEDDSDDVQAEVAQAKTLGIEEITIPMSGFFAPTDDDVADAMIELNRIHPVFIHCQHGKDRTGLVIALYRVKVDGWDPEKAFKEWIDLGHSELLFLMDHYYWTHID